MLWLDTLIKSEPLHFLFSALAGWLGYSLTLTILSVYLRSWPLATYASSSLRRAARFIRFIPLVVALLLALSAHSGLDALLDWYTTPLGPKLVYP